MSEEAIPTDVSAESQPAVERVGTTEAPETTEAEQKPVLHDPISKRERAMAAVAEKARDEREANRKAAALMNEPDLTEEEYDSRLEQERNESQPAGEEEAAAAEAGQASPNAGPEPPAATDQPKNGWYTNEQGQRVKRLMVNGQPRELTEEQYDRYIQKDMAGDEKLQRAAQIERQLADKARALQEKEQQLSQSAQTPPDQGASDEQVEQLLTEYHELLLDGDTDAARVKMREIMKAGRSNPTPVDPAAIARQVATQVKTEQAREAHDKSVKDAWAAFKQDYSALLSDDGAMAYADAQIKKLRAENPGMPHKDLFLTAGKLTAERLGLSGERKPSADTKAAADAARAERLERKGKITPLPGAVGKRNTGKPKVDVDHSPAAKIARMRQARVL